MVATAGLARSRSLHLGAVFQALAAAELVGRVVGGFRHGAQATPRLRSGLRYVLDLNAQAASPLSVRTEDDYAALRNFTGHGAASAAGALDFDPWDGLALLHLTTNALDAMWADPAVMTSFARCQIDPLKAGGASGQSEPVYVREIQAHLSGGNMPSAALRFDDWRQENLQIVLSTASQAVTGF
jgi:hypothetical protein